LPAHRAADRANGPSVTGYYTRDDLPFQYALAEAFTICDRYHCSVLGPTWSNRLYWMTATIDPRGAKGGPVTFNGFPSGHPYTWTTYAERLEAAGVSWKDYHYGTGLVGHGMLPQFKHFQDATPGSGGHVRRQRPAGDRQQPRRVGVDGARPRLRRERRPVRPRRAADRAGRHTGRVPRRVPIGAGFRAPCIVSPWSAGGYVCSEKFDHPSVLQFLEKVTGVMEPNITAWRRQTFGNLTRTLRLGHRAPAPFVGDTVGNLNLASYEAAQLPAPAFPGASQTVPHQEKGHRPRS
jgi:phospholipase C